MRRIRKIESILLIFVLLCCTLSTGCSIFCKHEWEEKWTHSDTYHWQSCTKCLKKINKGTHTFKDGACTVCGRKKAVSIGDDLGHSHEWAEEWSTDYYYHWHACGGCSDKGDYGTHEYSGDGACFCGYVKPHEHKWSEDYSYDDAYHWLECNGCDMKFLLGEHKYGEGDCLCGKPHVHDAEETWRSDIVHHWHDCKLGCGESVSYAYHDYSGGECVCGRTEPEVAIGLEYARCEGGGYEVTGLGSATSSDLIIPSEYNGEAVVAIGYRAFYRQSSLTSILLPDSVTKIGDAAFFSCTSLRAIVLGSGLAEIGESAFTNCLESVSSIEVSADNPIYKSENNCLLDKDGTRIILGCRNSVLPDTVTHIERAAFYNCKGLRKLDLPESVVSVAANAFDGCTSLAFAEYENGCYLGTAENPYAVLIKAKSDIILYLRVHPDTVAIADAACYNCRARMTVTIGSNVRYFGVEEDGFGIFGSTCVENLTVSMRALHSVSFGIKVRKVVLTDGEELATEDFRGWNELEELVLPEGLKRIDYAIMDCPMLTKVSVPNSIEYVGRYSFHNCPKIEYNPYKDLCYLGNDNRPYLVVMTWDVKRSSYELHNQTRVIAPFAFGKKTYAEKLNIQFIHIPKNIATIATDAFYGCALGKVYYGGTAEDWANVTVENSGVDDDAFPKARLYFYSADRPTADGHFWHYGDGNAVEEWEEAE